MPDPARHHEELSRLQHHRTTVRLSASNAQLTAQHQEHLILVLMRVPRKLPLNPRHLDVLVVNLAHNSRRPELGESDTRKL